MTLCRGSAADLDKLVDVQGAAYAKSRDILGVEPIPLLADYRAVLETMKVWLAADANSISGALILEPLSDHLLIWSIVATNPTLPPHGMGRKLLLAAVCRGLNH